MATELSTDQLFADVKRIVRDCEELLHATKDAMGEKAGEVRARLAEALDAAKSTCHRLEDQALDSAKAADRTIREHPYQSIGAAFGVGILLGVLLSRR